MRYVTRVSLLNNAIAIATPTFPTITPNAVPVSFLPKKKKHQDTLRARLMTWRIVGNAESFRIDRVKAAAKAMYRSVQTMGKTQLGGVYHVRMHSYQGVWTDCWVYRDPRAAVAATDKPEIPTAAIVVLNRMLLSIE
jgi:hypothetical protein